MEKLARRLRIAGWFLVPRIGLKGGILIAWHNNIKLDLVSFKHNICIFCLHDNFGNFWNLVCMYGSLNDVDKYNQWNHIKNFSAANNYPQIIIGDLNFIMHIEEKQGENNNTTKATRFIHDSIQELGMIYLRFQGIPFTWSNNWQGQENKERMDRALAFTEWTNIFPNVIVKHLIRVDCDHTPIMLETTPLKKLQKGRPFKILRPWLSHESIPEMIKNNWNHTSNGSNPYKFNNNLKTLIFLPICLG